MRIWQRLAVALAVLAGLSTGPAGAMAPEPPPPPGRLSAPSAKPPPAGALALPKAGERNAYGLALPPPLAEALAAQFAGDGAHALALLDAYTPPADDTLAAFEAARQRVHALLLAGRAAEAVDSALPALAAAEQVRFGDLLETPAATAETRLWLDDAEGAVAAAAEVLAATAGFRMPTTYTAPPPDMPGMVRRATAQIRAMVVMATARLAEDRPDEALAWAAEAEARLNDVHAVAAHPLYGLFLPAHADSWYGRGMNAAVLGAAALAAGRPTAEAEAAFTLANASFAAIGHRAGPVLVGAMRASGLRTAGLANRTLADPALADSALAAAAATAQEAAALGLPDLVWRAEAVAGALLFDQGRPDAAEPRLRAARLAMEAVSGGLGSDAAKRRFGVGTEDVTRRLAAIDLARGDMAALFDDLERGRARAFVDLLAHRSLGGAAAAVTTAAATAAAADSPVVAVRALDARLRGLRLRLAAPGGAGDPALAAAAEAAARDRAAALEALRATDPERADLLAVNAPPLADIQAALEDGATLAYGLPDLPGEPGHSPLRLLLVERDGARVEALGIDRRTLGDLTAALAAPETLLDPPRQEALAAKLRAAFALPALTAAKRLYVVPSGPLHGVPWGVLDLKGPVAVLPTAGWLRRAPGSASSGALTRAVVVGDPQPDGEYALPGARAEAAAVARLLGTRPLLGPQASEEAVRAAVGDGVAVLHLATHGVFDAAHPLRSAVLLADGNGGGGGDGGGNNNWLSAADLFARPLPARLVVLSACETGVGRAEAGDDFLGLPRSFYLGGARSVLASLWPVEDEGTRLFMTTFHEAARARNADLGRAWLRARDAVRKAGFPPSVYGAFVLGGGF